MGQIDVTYFYNVILFSKKNKGFRRWFIQFINTVFWPWWKSWEINTWRDCLKSKLWKIFHCEQAHLSWIFTMQHSKMMSNSEVFHSNVVFCLTFFQWEWQQNLGYQLANLKFPKFRRKQKKPKKQWSICLQILSSQTLKSRN